MEIRNHDDEVYFVLAIQTVLHRYRERIHSVADPAQQIPFIKEMSEEILERAQSFKTITESTITDLDLLG